MKAALKHDYPLITRNRIALIIALISNGRNRTKPCIISIRCNILGTTNNFIFANY
jgi:hypothetical protein